MGLYVIGRLEPDVRQLENSIIAEQRTQQLRLISVDRLLSLLELMADYGLSHEDILALLRPPGPWIDPVLDLLVRVAAQPNSFQSLVPAVPAESLQAPSYWLAPVRSSQTETAEERISRLVGQECFFAFSEHTPGVRHIKPGDGICFYATLKGVVADARVASAPERQTIPGLEEYPWVIRLEEARLYCDRPRMLDAELRAQLDAFRGRDLKRSWAWFVQTVRQISERDFALLTGR